MFANIKPLLVVEDAKLDLLLVTIATEPTDGYTRFMRTAERYGYNVKVSFILIENKFDSFLKGCWHGYGVARW